MVCKTSNTAWRPKAGDDLWKNCFPIWVTGKFIPSYVSKKINVNPANL